MPENKTDYKQFETYSKLMPVFSLIGLIIGMIIFRKMVLSGWHMPQSVMEGDGGPLIFLFVGFFTEVLPYVVALFPGGIPGYFIGYLAGVILALLFMLIAAIIEGIQNASEAHNERKYWKEISRARTYLLELCNAKEKAILMIQALIHDKDCRNIYYQCAGLFNYIGNTEIYEQYVNKKQESEKKVYDNARKILADYNVEINIDVWTMNSLYNWCTGELSKVRDIKEKIYYFDLIDLHRFIEEF